MDEEPAIQIELKDVMDDSELIGDLMHFIDEADQQGWLFDTAFISDLRQMVQQVQVYLLSDEVVQAASELSRFLELIEAVNSGVGPHGAGLTDNGYAQLFFIAIHLLERLPEPDK